MAVEQHEASASPAMPRVVAIVGPTASGKASLGRLAARRLSLPVLLALLDVPDYRVRQAAIENLGKLGDRGALPRLRAELVKSVHSREQRKLEEAIEALER